MHKMTSFIIGLAAIATCIAAIAFFGIFGPTAYSVSYLAAAAICGAALVTTLMLKDQRERRDRRVTLAQAGCAAVLCLGPLQLPGLINTVVIVVAAIVLLFAAIQLQLSRGD